MPLLALLREGTAAAQADAAEVVCNLARCPETVRAVATEREAIATCVHTLRQPSSSGSVLAATAATLWCITEAGGRSTVISDGGVRALLPLLGRGDESETHAVRAMCSLAFDSGSHSALSSGVAALVAIAGADSSAAGAAAAASTLHQMATGGVVLAQTAMACSREAVSLLVAQLSGSAEQQQQLAVQEVLVCHSSIEHHWHCW